MPIGVQRIVSHAQEKAAVDKQALLIFEFMTAYTALRAACPKGDLRIYLSVDEPQRGANMGEMAGD